MASAHGHLLEWASLAQSPDEKPRLAKLLSRIGLVDYGMRQMKHRRAPEMNGPEIKATTAVPPNSPGCHMTEEDRNHLAIADSERRLRFLDCLAAATRSLSEPCDIVQVTMRLLAEHLGASRCTYAQIEEDQDHFEVLGDGGDGVTGINGPLALSEFGHSALALMRANRPYTNSETDGDLLGTPADLTSYRERKIQAVAWVPLHRNDRLVAAVELAQNEPRDWSPDEVELTRLVVARCCETLDRARAEKILREAHERLSLAFSAGEFGHWSWDAATDLVTLGERAADIFSLPHSPPVTWAEMRQMLHVEDRVAGRMAVDSALASREIYRIEYRFDLPDGGQRWVSVQGRGLYSEDGTPKGMIGTVQDVTQRRVAHEVQREEASMLELLNQTGAALAAELDLQSLLQRVTDAATTLIAARFGAFFYNGADEQGDALLLYTLSGAPKEAFDKFGHPRPTGIFGPTFNGGPPIRSDDITQDPRYGLFAPHHGMPPGHLPVRSYLAVSVISRTGSPIGGLFFGHPEPGMFNARSERLVMGIAGQAAIAVDNARLYAEAQRAGDEREVLLENERIARQDAEHASRMKDEFLATLSHELRTPLSAILGWSQILQSGPVSPEILARGIDTIGRNAKAQAKLIEDLLDMSRIVSGKVRLDIQPTDLGAVVASTVDTIRPSADARNIRLRTIIDPVAGMVAGDQNRLQQVVWNLLSNAVKFTPPGGTIDVQVTRADSNVEVKVADSGIGIDRKFLPHVFDRFRQGDSSISRAHGGLGLGLSIVRQLVELHGGTVDVDSRGEQCGATFVVRLPLAPTRALMSDPGSSSIPIVLDEHANLKGVRVLVVDDEADTRELLRTLLQRFDAGVATANNATEALSLVSSTRPDIIISDVGMPGTDGYEFMRQVRALPEGKGGKTPAIALTAFASSHDRTLAMMAGYQVHVAKPFEAHELIATLLGMSRRL